MINDSSTNTSSTWEWSGDFEDGKIELLNKYDNSFYGYSGNRSFEIMDFQSSIIVSYSSDTSTTSSSKFRPDYESYELIVDSNLPPNLKLDKIISGNSLNINLSGNLGLLKDYAPPFFLPNNFTFDQYDSPDGFYAHGYNLIKAGGNYSYIVNQPSFYVINLNLTVNIYSENHRETQSTLESDEEAATVKSTSKNFTITVGRNYSAMRNQFIAGYLEEQISRGDVDYYTYKGVKYYDSQEYLRVLINDLGWSYYF